MSAAASDGQESSRVSQERKAHKGHSKENPPRFKKITCSFFSGRAKPLMMDPKISSSSPMPLWRSVSYTKR